jgi:malate dehydrogenase (oxaloacetate-decarboxylating)
LRISQCNNAFVFPGLGLGVIAVKATRVTDKMIEAAARTLSESSPVLKDPNAPVLPDFDVVREVSKKIALAVAEQARKEGVASVDNDLDLKEKIDAIFWEPEYLPYSN